MLMDEMSDVSVELGKVGGVGGSLRENSLGTSRFNASSRLRDALVTYFISGKGCVGGLWSLSISFDIDKSLEWSVAPFWVVNYDDDR